MAVTTVLTDKTEYCRYHAELNIITVTIVIENPIAGAALSVALFRLDGYGAVVTKTVTLTSATQYQVLFNLTADTYDALGIYRAKQGDYVIQTTDAAGVIVDSPMFAVSIVPVVEMRTEWVKGVTFFDYEVLLPRIQPQLVTGVVVTEVSTNHFKGPFQLVFTVGSPSTLSWAGGPNYPLATLAPQTLLLLDNRQEDYILVDVNPLLLPATSQTETLYIDNGRITDRAFIHQLRRATEWVEQQIITKIEPQIITTDPTTVPFYDEIAIPETYYRPRTFNKWLSFKIPYANILDLSMSGYFNQSPVATIPRQWLDWDERTGIAELIPSTSAEVIWSFYNGIFVMAYLFDYASIPGFWHYTGTVGMRDLNNQRGVVREAIAKKAAIELLNSAGSAYRAGFASQSTSRDGVSESSGYTSSAMYGTYGAHFQQYQTWLTREVPRMKSRFVGIQFVSI